MIEFVISQGSGTLVEQGVVSHIGDAGEAFDRHVFTAAREFREDAKGDGRYVDDGKLRHLYKGKWSMTTMPKGYAG